MKGTTMCGIFGVSRGIKASKQVFEGLTRLDYRGYDSWGIAALVAEGGALSLAKEVGGLPKVLPKSLSGLSTVAIGHTRWATHGAVTKLNAHPHLATDGTFALAQNGIVENYLTLKSVLSKKGYTFISETDTEVIVRLIEEERKSKANLSAAVRSAFLQLKGRNTIIILDKTGTIMAARNGSPLVVGKAENAHFFSSDALSLASVCKEIMVLENGQMVICNNTALQVFTIESNTEVVPTFVPIGITDTNTSMAGFDHFMIKEIFDTPEVIKQVYSQPEAELKQLATAIKKAHHAYTIASGTAGLAAAQAAYYLRSLAGQAVTAIVGAEAESYIPLWSSDDLIIAPSQSGETADVLEVLEVAKARGMQIASYVNMPGSLMTRMSDYPFMANAGSERCVMSTKVFASQVAWGYLLAKTIGGDHADAVKQLKRAEKSINEYLKDQKNHLLLQKLARMLIQKQSIFLLGKGQNLEIVKEGMVKIIEGTYLHAHAIPAGDLKHYAITIMEKGVPVIVALSNDGSYADVTNAVAQVKARGAMVIGLSPMELDAFEYHVPTLDLGDISALATLIPLQLLAYYMTVALGNPVDKPRNIAKSVTVK